MKRPLLFLFAVTVIASAAGVMDSVAQSRRNRAAREFMQQKLEHAQKILEGLTLEDHALIREHAQKLAAMSRAAEWPLFENPEYTQFNAGFRREVESLILAARNKNLDGAALAYLQMTMSCVQCHKFVRGRLVASHRGSAMN